MRNRASGKCSDQHRIREMEPLDAIISAATCSGSRRNAPGRSAYRGARDSTGLADSKDPASRQISCGP
jgi:hypothetical protein